jgi:hypothetical protein
LPRPEASTKAGQLQFFDWGNRKEREELEKNTAAIQEFLQPGERVDIVGFAQVGPWVGTYPFISMYFKHLAVLTDRRFILAKISPWTRLPTTALIDVPTSMLSVARIRERQMGLPLSLWVRPQNEPATRLNFSALHEDVGLELRRRLTVET